MAPGEGATLLLAHLETGGSAAILVRTEPSGGTGPSPRLLVLLPPGGEGDPRSHGTLGRADLDQAGLELALRLISHPGEIRDPLHLLALPEGGAARVYGEVHHPPASLVIVGAGHIARPLAELGQLLGFQVTVLDDRPVFATRERFPSAADVRVVDFSDPFAGIPIHRGTHVVLVTRGHRYDYECLLRLLGGAVMPGYLGLIGSRRRIRATFAQLVPEGIPRERIAAIRAPLGLDLGAQTPAEIAVAVAAELVLLHRGGSGAPLRERERVLERFFPVDGTPDAGAGEPRTKETATPHDTGEDA